MKRESLHEYWLSSIPSDSPLKNYVQSRTQYSKTSQKEEIFSENPRIDVTKLHATIEKEILKWMKKMK